MLRDCRENIDTIYSEYRENVGRTSSECRDNTKTTLRECWESRKGNLCIGCVLCTCFLKKVSIYLVVTKKSSTFAVAFEMRVVHRECRFSYYLVDMPVSHCLMV